MEWFQRNTLGKEIGQTVGHVACVIVLDVSGASEFLEIDALRTGIEDFRKTLAKDKLVCGRIALALVEASGSFPRVLGGFTTANIPFQFEIRSGGACAFKSGVELSLRGISQIEQNWRTEGYVIRRPVLVTVSSLLSTAEMAEAVSSLSRDSASQIGSVRCIAISAREALLESVGNDGWGRVVLDADAVSSMFEHSASLVAASVETRLDRLDAQDFTISSMPYRGMLFFDTAYESVESEYSRSPVTSHDENAGSDYGALSELAFKFGG